MTTRRPHDLDDLLLAPTALRVDERLEDLGRLTTTQLAYRVALDANLDDRTEADRLTGLLETVGYLLDLRGWKLTWDPRGIRMSHGDHSLVLGAPPVFARFVAGDYEGVSVSR